MGQAWHTGSNNARPLRERYSEVAGELAALGHRAETPITEQTLFNNLQLLEKVRPSPAWDEMAAVAGREFEAVVRQYRTLHGEIVAMQNKVAQLKNDPVLQLLGLVTDEVLRPPTPTQDMLDAAFGRVPRTDSYEIPGKVYTPDFATAMEYRRAITRVTDKLLGLRLQEAAIHKVWHFQSSDPAEQACKAVIALQRQQAARMSALQERVDELENITHRLGLRLRSRRQKEG